MHDNLPPVITACDEYKTLTSIERDAFKRRILSSKDLGCELSSGSRLRESPTFFQFVESLELDAAHLQEFESSSGGGLSRWLVHYSWTFYTTPEAMRNALSWELVQQLDAAGPRLDSPLHSYEVWFTSLGTALERAVDTFMASTHYDSAMSHILAVDLLLNEILTSCYKLRLSPLVPR